MKRLQLSPDQQHSRAENAVAEMLFRSLIVPKVFVNASWPGRGSHVDVMAVDRSGSGEVHIVEVKIGTKALSTIEQSIARLMQIPAHFRYIALTGNGGYSVNERKLYAPDGLGRVGLIQVNEDARGDLSAEVRLRPERFKFEDSFKRVDKFTTAHPAHIEIRP